MIIPAIIYTLASFVIFAIGVSFSIAYKRKKSLPVLSMMLFFYIDAIVIFAISLAFWQQIFVGDFVAFPYPTIRGTFLLAGAIFLLYTCWQERPC